MIDTSVYIDNLRVHAFHGVLSQERTVGNDYVINVEVGYPWQRSMTTDNVNDTLNYAVLADLIVEEMNVPSQLLEAVAGRIAERIKSEFCEVTSITLDIKKVNPPVNHDTDGCGVVLKWRKQG